MPEQTPDQPLLDKALQDEIASALEGLSLDDLMNQPAAGQGPTRDTQGRQLRSGVVVSVGAEDIMLEFGPKLNGIVPRSHFTDEDLPRVGRPLEVLVDRRDPNEGILICSRPGQVAKAEWEYLEVGQTVEARVTGTNKGGLELEVCNHRAFMPASQVDVRHVEDLNVMVGELLVCEVTKIEREGRGNIVLSRRIALEREMERAREQLKDDLKVGQTREGVVTKIMPFGAFVDIGGMDGLVHISDLSYERVRNAEDVVTVGQKVQVLIMDVDFDKNRISLGMKQLQADPFQEAAVAIAAGSELSGRVTKILDFGVFVELQPGVEGLVHISELAPGRVKSCRDVVEQDQVIKVKVLDVDSDKRRISLSVKQVGPSEEQVEQHAKETRKESAEMRRLREKFGNRGLKGGL
jgi:ribosomal protein S1